ncbi:MAG: TetR/AcrR family transcriptional regulator [Candidatus Sericytochromatia bacterium]
MAPSKPYHHGDLKQELIKAALQAIESRGQVEFNLRELAQTCGVSVAALYRHFASKHQLLIELARLGFESLHAHYAAIMQDASLDGPQRLRALGLAYVHFAMDHEGLFRVMFYRELCQLPEFAQIEDVANATLAMLQRALNTAPEACDSALSAPVLAAWARVHGLAFLWLDRNLNLSREAFLAQLDAILRPAP